MKEYVALVLFILFPILMTATETKVMVRAKAKPQRFHEPSPSSARDGAPQTGGVVGFVPSEVEAGEGGVQSPKNAKRRYETL